MAPRVPRTSVPPPETPGVLPASLPGFDLVSAGRRLGGNTALLADLLRTFAAEHAGAGEQIAALLVDRRPATAAAELHRLKSAARIVGAQALAAAAEALEHDVRQGNDADVAVFRSALADALGAIGTHVGVADPPHASKRHDANPS